MNIPLSWLKEYVDMDIPLDELARVLTMAGLEVDGVTLVGLPGPENDQSGFKFSGLTWERDKFVVAQIDEVMPHPNADRLTLCRLNDGEQELVVLTGAPNLYDYKGAGPLAQPLKVAYAREGARLYDGHQAGNVLTTLKRTKIRGVESFSMVCSEKELGISEEHEGIILLDADAPTGMPLVDYMGDAVFEISILPNMIRNASVIGVARELAAQLGKPLRKPTPRRSGTGPAMNELVKIEIVRPDLNPRFMVGLVRDVRPESSPYWVQRRLRLCGMRPINAIVDATNYVMLETGEPLHAFDYDVLVQRAGGKTPTIITRTAAPGEKLTTLDNIERTLEDYTILVCDTAGALSLAGVMGGLESEVTENTRNVLLEGASWNFVNVRRTSTALRLVSEAAYRFARGVHPALAEQGVDLCLSRIAEWGGGEIAAGRVDAYPNPPVDPLIELSEDDVKRALGVEIPAARIAELLTGLEFGCIVAGKTVSVQTPPTRLDIGQGVIGKADLLEEVARLFGYDNIPVTRISDELPPFHSQILLDRENRLREVLVSLGLQETITYRLTSVEREARLLPQEDAPYIRLANPIAPERSVMRRNLLASTLEILEKNIRLADHLALFEIGPVFLAVPGERLPNEQQQLSLAMTGLRTPGAWDVNARGTMDFFDLKGVLEAVFDSLHISDVHYTPFEHPVYHPGKCALVQVGEIAVGVFGELHPTVKERYDFLNAPVLAGTLDLTTLLSLVPERYAAEPVPVFPPVLEDIAVIVDEDLPAEKLEAVIRQGGGKMLTGLRLFDIYRGEQIGAGKKSLAYSLTYQSDRTLTDKDAAQIRARIIRRLEQELGAKLRS